MSFRVTDNNLFEEYTKIWRGVGSLMNIDFDSEPAYGDIDNYIKTKTKMYDNKVNTNFQGKEVPKENTSYDCLSLITLDSVIRVNKKYYPQTLLQEHRDNLINDDLELDTDSESYNKFESESEND